MNFKLLDRPIAFQRAFVEVCGSVTGALFLSQAVYWQNRCTSEDGWWWKTIEQWQEETGLSRKEQETARKYCDKFLRCELRGVPARNHFHLDFTELQTSLSETGKLVRPKRANKLVRNGQTGTPEMDKLLSTESTSESTTENTSDISESIVDLELEPDPDPKYQS